MERLVAIKGILFDKDGTLIDVNGTWVAIYRRMLSDLFATDAEGAEQLMERAGYDRFTQQFKAGSILAGGTTRQLIDIWWPGLDEPGAAERQRILDVDYAPIVKDYLKPLMPLEPILAELRNMGLLLGVATNDSIVSARNHLEHLAVAHHFDAVITADTVEVPKPSGDMIRKFSSLTGLDPSEIAMVGDNTHDIEEARNGGAGLAVAVLSGNAGHEDIAHLADHTLASIAELPAFLRSL
jgi:phosphoglycolate phosphatase